MTLSAPMLDDRDFAQLTYGDRLGLSKALSKSYGLMVGLVVVFGCALLLAFAGVLFSLSGFSLEALQGETPGLPAAGFAAFFVVAVLSQVLVVGLNRLLLFLTEGRQPDGGVLPILLSPWARFSPVFLSILLWLLLTVAFQMVFGFLGQLPGLGLLLDLAASLILSMVTNCAMLYIADRLEDLSPADAVLGTLRIVGRNFSRWLGAMVTLVALYVPGLVLVAIGAHLFLSGSATGLGAGALLIAGLAAVLVAAIFGFFFLAVTYRHTKGRLIASGE